MTISIAVLRSTVRLEDRSTVEMGLGIMTRLRGREGRRRELKRWGTRSLRTVRWMLGEGQPGWVAHAEYIGRSLMSMDDKLMLSVSEVEGGGVTGTGCILEAL